MSAVNQELFKAQVRRCWIVFAAVASATFVMVAASYAPFPNRTLATSLVLAVAAFNAFLVSGYLMHLISEKKTIYALLAFTMLFFTTLLYLTWWSEGDRPALAL